jgi:subtilase family serine protease
VDRGPRIRRSAIALLGAVLAVTALLLPAAPASAHRATAQLAALRAQVARGDLLRTHGVRSVCPRCDALVVTRGKGATAPLSTKAPAGYGPRTLARAYHLPRTDTRARTTIAVIDAGVNPKLAKNLYVYRKQYGLPVCALVHHCLRLLDYLGGQQPVPPNDPTGRYWNEQVAVETSLDMDAASAGCPSCKLIEVSVPWQDAIDNNDVSTGDFVRAVRTAVRAGAKVISISYGFSADVRNTSGNYLKQLSRKGIAIVASTGDNGFNGGAHQNWPSDLPAVIAVGGTTLPKQGPETAWYAAGSGCETQFPAAAGQPARITRLCAGHRAAADISADADPATGLAVYDTYAPYSHQPGNWLVVGGTSASAPFLGGLFGRAGELATVYGPRTLYAAPRSDFTDITTGQTFGFYQCKQFHGVSPRLCRATKFWDGPTGLGSPIGLGAFRPSRQTIQGS